MIPRKATTRLLTTYDYILVADGAVTADVELPEHTRALISNANGTLNFEIKDHEETDMTLIAGNERFGQFTKILVGTSAGKIWAVL